MLSREEVRCKQWQLCEETQPADNGGVEPLQGGKMRVCGRMWGVKCWRKLWRDCKNGASPLRRTPVLRNDVSFSLGSLFPFPLEECYCVQADQRLTALGNTRSWDTAPVRRCAIARLWRETQTLDQLRSGPPLPQKVLFNSFTRDAPAGAHPSLW